MPDRVDPAKYYSREDVAREIAEWLDRRWAAAALESGGWLRWRGDAPLRVTGPGDVLDLARAGARSFFGTIEVFRRLETEYDVIDGYQFNVEGASSFVDIDILEDERVGEAWVHAIEAARAIAEWLEKRAPGAVYLLWSGAGVHVRVCWKPLARAAQKSGVDPLYAAYIAAEASIRAVRDRLESIVGASGLVKVENVVSRNRLFTAPLSLHRRLDMVAVAFKPSEAGLFTLSWASPESYRHDPEAWRSALEGEAYDLVSYALETLGRGPVERTVIAPERPPRRRARLPARPAGVKIGRFPVMALLQAARYYVLNRDLEKAKSFGLNRAIFYAWAKYYGPARSAARRLASAGAAYARRYGAREARSYRLEKVPGMREEAPVSPDGWFVMGGIEQRPEDFDRHVARRFEEAGIPFEEAWRAAVEYVSRFPPSVLRDPRLFYERVYLPVRDNFERVLAAEPVRPRLLESRRREERREPRQEKRRQKTLLDWLGGEEEDRTP